MILAQHELSGTDVMIDPASSRLPEGNLIDLLTKEYGHLGWSFFHADAMNACSFVEDVVRYMDELSGADKELLERIS
jgi:hypothetical protein